MKRILLSVLACLAVNFSAPALAVTISINQFLEHPSLDEAVRGFKEQLAQDGIEATYNLYTAQANMATTASIVNQIIGERPDLILAVATPSAQATAQKIKDIPVLFSAVSDPLSSGLVDSLERPGHNVTGTSDMSPIDEQMALIREIHPQARSLGIIFNAGETNSPAQIKLLEAVCPKYGFKLEQATTVNTAGVYQAAKSLVGRADIIYLLMDNTVISNIETIRKICVENQIPLYSSETDSVRRASIASLALSYYELGRQTAKMAKRILSGEARPADIPVETQKEVALVINLKAARDMGVTLPRSVLELAREIIE